MMKHIHTNTYTYTHMHTVIINVATINNTWRVIPRAREIERDIIYRHRNTTDNDDEGGDELTTAATIHRASNATMRYHIG